MREDDVQLGKPIVVYKDTKANIEALTSVVQGSYAYATDTDEPGWYDGASWHWIGAGAGLDNVAYLDQANSFTLINPLTTIAESWIGPSSTTGIYFKGGNVGIGVTDPDTTLEVYKVGTQLKLSGGAADYMTVAVAANGATTFTTVDADAAEADIILSPDGDVVINALLNTGAGRIVNTTRVTAVYTALVTDYMIYADTDGGAFTITLPAGVEGQYFRIANVGSSLNNLTIDGDGAETVRGALTQTLYDGDIIIVVYNATEGWV